jgi:hypothetical protein
MAKKIADKTWVLTAYDTSASDGSSAITATNKGKAAPATDENRGKGTNNPSNGQEKEKETAQSFENKGKSQTPQGKAQPEEVQPKEKIGDVGEKIGGARKDLAKDMADKINLKADTFDSSFVFVGSSFGHPSECLRERLCFFESLLSSSSRLAPFTLH